jgi:hypothetical protein
MAVAVHSTEARACLGCGELVEADVAFCSTCGTRQIPDRPMPVTASTAEADRLERSTHTWLLLALVVGAVLLLVVGLMVGGLMATTRDDDGAGGGGTADAADTMDAYAPLAEGWLDKHEHVAEEANDGDPNGLAAAAEDARMWVDVNRADIGAIAAGADGGSAGWYQELVTIFVQRAAVLAEIDAVATAGGGGPAAADELATLAELDDAADAATCEIAEVMRAEGDDPDDHITPGMYIAC